MHPFQIDQMVADRRMDLLASRQAAGTHRWRRRPNRRFATRGLPQEDRCR
jgi:hypothetical protein